MPAGRMQIGYIVRKNMILSRMAELYIQELRRYLEEHAADREIRERKQDFALTDAAKAGIISD